MFEDKYTLGIAMRVDEINKEVNINQKTNRQKRVLDHGDIKGLRKENQKRKLRRSNL